MDTTQFVPNGEGYTRPPTAVERIGAQLHRLPRVDANGWPLPAGATTDATPVIRPDSPHELIVRQAALGINVHPYALLDSASLMAKIETHDVDDLDGISHTLAGHVASHPELLEHTPTMRPNPAQGASAGAPIGVAPSTLKESMRALAAQALYGQQ